jgi:regulator of sigma E protease
MGPHLFSKKIGDTTFAISAIPLGGYVEVANVPEDTSMLSATDLDTFFSNKPYWQKMLVMGGGILFNLIFAYLAFFFLYAVGMPNTRIVSPENARPAVGVLMQDSPASKANLQVGDTIVSINGQNTNDDIEQFFNLIRPLANQKALFVIDRNGTQHELSVAVGEQKIGDQTIGYLGIAPATSALKPYAITTSLKKAFNRVNHLFMQTFLIFKWMFAQKSVAGLGGPIMIFSQTIQQAEQGLKVFLAFLAFISIQLGVLNLIPLPILDGGQALFVTIEAIIRRPLPIKLREYLAVGTWVLFLGLTLYLSFKDVSMLRKQQPATQEQKD